MGKILGKVSYDGCTMTYSQTGNVKVIVCRKGHTTCFEVANNLSENTDKIWSDIKAEARASV